VTRQLDLLRSLAGVRTRARVTTGNSFPSGAGIASSASGMAALTVAGVAALGLGLGQRELSILARRGSGSACRSIAAGFVEWLAGHDDASSYAVQVAAPEHWPLVDVAVVVSHETKRVSSSEGHQLALASPFWQARLAGMQERIDAVRLAILERDFERFGRETEAEALAMHAVALTSAHESDGAWRSGVFYWAPDTLALLIAAQEWRAQGLPVYFTLDAGPTVHLLCLAEHAGAVVEAVRDLAAECGDGGWDVIVNAAGDGARVIG
jgi:diphosphomevalonate decarboxylase